MTHSFLVTSSRLVTLLAVGALACGAATAAD